MPTTWSRNQGIAPGSHKSGIEVFLDLLCPDRAGISGVLPGRTGHAVLIRVGTQKMGDDLHVIIVEQGGLRPDKRPGKVGAGGDAYVVLGARGVSQQERPVPCWYLEPRGYRRWGDIVGIQPLWQQGEAAPVRTAMDVVHRRREMVCDVWA